jgi:hypothetical protein
LEGKYVTPFAGTTGQGRTHEIWDGTTAGAVAVVLAGEQAHPLAGDNQRMGVPDQHTHHEHRGFLLLPLLGALDWSTEEQYRTDGDELNFPAAQMAVDNPDVAILCRMLRGMFAGVVCLNGSRHTLNPGSKEVGHGVFCMLTDVLFRLHAQAPTVDGGAQAGTLTTIRRRIHVLMYRILGAGGTILPRPGPSGQAHR